MRFESDVRGEGNYYVPSMCVDVQEDGYLVTVRVPGAERDELHVSLHGAVLRIAGERRHIEHRRDAEAQEDTHCFSRFTREAYLAREVAAEEAQAHFEHGELTVWLPFVHNKQVEEDEAIPIDIR